MSWRRKKNECEIIERMIYFRERHDSFAVGFKHVSNLVVYGKLISFFFI